MSGKTAGKIASWVSLWTLAACLGCKTKPDVGPALGGGAASGSTYGSAAKAEAPKEAAAAGTSRSESPSAAAKGVEAAVASQAVPTVEVTRGSVSDGEAVLAAGPPKPAMAKGGDGAANPAGSPADPAAAVVVSSASVPSESANSAARSDADVRGEQVAAGDGWFYLPVDDLRIRREAEQFLVEVSTRTASQGWEIKLSPLPVKADSSFREYDLLGKPPAAAETAAVEDRKLAVKEGFPPEVRTIIINGRSGKEKASSTGEVPQPVEPKGGA